MPGDAGNVLRIIGTRVIDPRGGQRALVSGVKGSVEVALSQPERFFATKDRGSTWREVTMPVPSTPSMPAPLTVDGRGGLYMTDPTGRMFRSTDWAATWKEMGKLPVADLSFGPMGSLRSGELFAWPPFSSGDLWRTVDGGATWKPIDASVGFELELAVGSGDVLLGWNKGRPVASTDAGRSWRERAYVIT
jgi:photosystem II stability/assembly factor-like uncharacterized protein